MNLLFFGGTGTISSAVTSRLLKQGHHVTLVNRGNSPTPPGADAFVCDISCGEAELETWLKGKHFDAVADFIAYKPEDIERDIRLFSGKTDQFIFISSASAYQKPPQNDIISESTLLVNPYWEYSRNKIACEERLIREYRTSLFPITIVRPSHTYGDYSVPVGLHGKAGSWQVICRMMENKPVILHGDGTTLWTMTHNSDFAKGFVGLIGNVHAIGETVHITSDERLTWLQIYHILYRALGKKPNLVPVSSDFIQKSSPGYGDALLGDKACSAIFDNSKIKRLVPGYCAEVRADEGLPRSLSYMLAHPEMQRPDPEFDRWCDKVVAAREHALAQVLAQS